MTAARAVAAIGALLAMLLAIHAVRCGIAGIDGRTAQDTLARLDAGRVVRADEIAAARARARAARDFAPRHGAPDEWLARLALHAAADGDAVARRALRAAAREHAAAAWRARPAWPYAAATVAAAEAADQRFGARFAAAAQAAWRHGRHERRVRELLAGLWLRPAARDGVPVLALAFDAALAREPERWIDAADRAGAGPAACARPAAPRPARARCEQLGWPATADARRG
jgi:hypothetical protein